MTSMAMGKVKTVLEQTTTTALRESSVQGERYVTWCTRLWVGINAFSQTVTCLRASSIANGLGFNCENQHATVKIL